ncbi:hypothetical protein [Archaeoglobus sp.]
MNGEEAMKKLLALNIANYSHIVDPAAFLRETENYLAIVQALTGEEFREELRELWKEWDEALEEYGTPRSGWKETWKKCGRIRAKLFEIMTEKDLIHVTSDILNIDRIQFGGLESTEE